LFPSFEVHPRKFTVFLEEERHGYGPQFYLIQKLYLRNPPPSSNFYSEIVSINSIEFSFDSSKTYSESRGDTRPSSLKDTRIQLNSIAYVYLQRVLPPLPGYRLVERYKCPSPNSNFASEMSQYNGIESYT